MPQRYWPTSPLPSQPGGWALAGGTAGDSGTVVIVVEGATVVAVVVGAGVVVGDAAEEVIDAVTRLVRADRSV